MHVPALNLEIPRVSRVIMFNELRSEDTGARSMRTNVYVEAYCSQEIKLKKPSYGGLFQNKNSAELTQGFLS